MASKGAEYMKEYRRTGGAYKGPDSGRRIRGEFARRSARIVDTLNTVGVAARASDGGVRIDHRAHSHVELRQNRDRTWTAETYSDSGRGWALGWSYSPRSVKTFKTTQEMLKYAKRYWRQK